MGERKFYKCSFKHCSHESRDVPVAQAVKVNKRYMHKDCAEINENIDKIKSLYYNEVSKTVVFPQLIRVINNIIFSKNVPSDYLLFALEYSIKNKYKITSPYGLHYIIDYQRIKDAWKKKQAEALKEEMMKREDEEDEAIDFSTVGSFNFSNDKPKGFDTIFGMGDMNE